MLMGISQLKLGHVSFQKRPFFQPEIDFFFMNNFFMKTFPLRTDQALGFLTIKV